MPNTAFWQALDQTHVDIKSAQLLSSNDALESAAIIGPEETALQALLQQLPQSSSRHAAISSFKDKYRFRQLLQKQAPGYPFYKISVKELAQFKPDFTLAKCYIVKPIRGFFGVGVHKITPQTDLAALSQTIAEKLNQQQFERSIQAINWLLIEAQHEGDEYAFDAYFNANGEPEILAIYQHPVADNPDYIHLLYYTSATIFNQFYEPITSWLKKINHHFQLKNFALHGEFIWTDNKINPIEINACRFGGFGLGELIYYGLDIHAYNAFFSNQKIDWPTVWQEFGDENLAWILAYQADNAAKPNHDKLQAFFGRPGQCLSYQKIDEPNSPVTAKIYTRLSKADIQETRALNFNHFTY